MAEARSRAMIRPVDPEPRPRTLPVSRFVDGEVTAEPAVPTDPLPRGDLRTAGWEEIYAVSRSVWDDWRTRSLRREVGIRKLLEHLEQFPGTTWAQRWAASGLDDYAQPVRARFTTKNDAVTACLGAGALFCLRVVRPTLPGLRTNRLMHYPETFRIAQADPYLDAFFEHVTSLDVSLPQKQRVLNDVCVAITVQGITLADLTPAALAAYCLSSRNLTMTDRRKHIGHLAWEALWSFGQFPKTTPRTLKGALLPRRATPAELVDRHRITNPDIRSLLIAYLERRAHDMDYVSLLGVATNLVKNFWLKIQAINPDQADLRLAPRVYALWREQIRFLDDGVTPRVDPDTPMMAVRAFYFDLQAWATQEPQRWAQWVAPCPVLKADTRGGGVRRRRIHERMAERTRARQPLLPLLVAHVDREHRHLIALLAAATLARSEETFAVDGRCYRRVFSRADQHRADSGRTVHVRVVDTATGATVHVGRAEQTAFWAWAIVEVLRHSGVRVEELTELSQLSVRQYVRPNGEVVALLVIAPSKSDRERVIPMSPELFHAIAMIISRVRGDRRDIPLVTAYDTRERMVLGPLPLLLQRPVGGRAQALTGGGVYSILLRACRAVAVENPEFAEVRFTPHDFRRIFATELVNTGLPIHIGAALLGHLNIETTRGYVAVFTEDVVAHYQTYLAHRRTLRPSEEYPSVTAGEWAEFEEHFDHRKVELGTCARPYQTRCQHEHACIRCPMLHIDPDMLNRLDELETDLLRRRTEAEARGWLGELEGLALTLRFLDDKRAQATRLRDRAPVQLGMPAAGARATGT